MTPTLRDIVKIALLWPWALAYGIVIIIRNILYDYGALRTESAGMPVVSVGNITAGGTGKTPLAIMLARMLARRGLRAAIVSRGYRRARQAPEPLLVSDGAVIKCPAAEAGDEPYLMAARLLDAGGKGGLVIVGRDRARAAKLAEQLGADVIVLDDGFQHRRLSRNVDLVLLDSARPLDNGWLLPAGLLREPPWSLRRATAVIATRCGPGPLPSSFQRLGTKGTKVFRTQHRPGQPHQLKGFGSANPPSLVRLTADRPVMLFSGIANPNSFEDSVRELGLAIGRHLRYPDHHAYSEQDLKYIASTGRNFQAVITTEKDAVRLPPRWDPGCQALVLPVEIQFQTEADANEFEQFILQRIGR